MNPWVACVLIILAGCSASLPPRAVVLAPSTAPIRSSISLARASTGDARKSTRAALDATTAARALASGVLTNGAAAGSPVVTELVRKVEVAIRNNAETEAFLATTSNQLAAAEAQIAKLEVEAAKLSEFATQQKERLDYLEPKYQDAVAIVWKWRILAIGTWVGVLLLVVGRGYLKGFGFG